MKSLISIALVSIFIIFSVFAAQSIAAPKTITKYVSLMQDLHHPTKKTTNTRSQVVKVPPGNKLVQLNGGHWYKWSETSQNNCRGERFEIYKDPNFGIPIGIKVSGTLTSGPKYDRWRGWLKGNLTIAYEPISVQ